METRVVVSGLYRAMLGREPHLEEEAPYLQFLAGGGDPADLARQVLESPECQVTFFKNPAFRRLIAPDPPQPPTPLLYVWHIPKTAGTSLREMLAVHFPPERFCGSLTLSELYRLSPARLRSFSVIAGHFGPVVPRLLGAVPMVSATLVREPVATVASVYREWRYRGPEGHNQTLLSQRLPFEEWCHHEDSRQLWSNPQARALALTRIVSPWPVSPEAPEGDNPLVADGQLREMAVTVLNGIDVVGTSEDVLAVYRACVQRIGLVPVLKEPVRANVSEPDRKFDIFGKTRDWLLANNDIDQGLYEQARARRVELATFLNSSGGSEPPARPLPTLSPESARPAVG
jgi:hypothetical protein